MKKKQILLLMFVSLVFCFSGCEKEFTKYYEYDGSTETIYEILEGKGNFTYFLEALDAVGYGRILSSSGLFTVLAPNDAAFESYLNNKGYSKITDIPEDEMRTLMGYHIIDWPYVASGLISGYSSIDLPNDPTMIRKLTRCEPPVYADYDFFFKKERTVVSEKKLMPFFSKSYFDAVGADANDIKQFYPELNLDLEKGDVIASNGKLVEKDISAINGWLHIVDRVLEPLKNHKDILESEEKYSLYNNLAKIFKSYSYSESFTNELQIDNDGNGDNDSVFVMNWGGINKEYVGIGSSISGNSDKIEVQKSFITSFIPTNDALTSFLSTYYPGVSTDEVINTIPPSALFKIVRSCIHQGEAYFPSAIAGGKLKSRFGINYIYNEGDYEQKQIVSNGIFYGVNNFRVPDEFNALTKIFMTDSTYSHFLVALDFSGFLDLVVSENVKYTVFALKNKVFRELGLFLNSDQTGFIDEEGEVVAKQRINGFLENQIVLGELDVKSFEGNKFYKTVSPRETYLRISADNISADGVSIGNIIGDGDRFGNGVVYEVDNFIAAPNPDINIAKYLKNTARFSNFYALLLESGVIIEDGATSTVIYNEGNMTCFAPTNDAIANSTLPEDDEELKSFLSKFFVKTTIYSDGQKQGVYETFSKDLANSSGGTNSNIKVNISTDSGVITITNRSTNAIASTVEGYESDIMLVDGCIHTIESIY